MIFSLLVALLFAAVEDTAGLKASVLSEASLGHPHEIMADSQYEQSSKGKTTLKDDSDGGECGCREVCTPPWVFIGESCLLTDLTVAVSWSEARIYCQERNAASDLVVFKDANEFAEVLRHIRNINNPKKVVHFWIGGVDESNTDNWFWVTGEKMPLGAPFWGGDYSGGEEPSIPHNEPCVLLWYNNRYYINDTPCNHPGTVPLCQYRPA